MSDTALPGPKGPAARNFFAALQLDTRLLGMIGAFIVLCLAFNVFTDGRFLTPRNIFTLTIQTVSVAIMATGMVFVIVTRHIDLSVGSVLGTVAAVMAVLQKEILPQYLELGHPTIWIISIIVGMVIGVAIGAFHGWLVGYQGIPAFIVTLGGLLVWRAMVWFITSGQTIGPLDETFVTLGGVGGTLGEFWSWVFGVLAVGAVIWLQIASRRRKASHGFPVKPMWAEVALSGITTVAILGFVSILNAYEIPARKLKRIYEANGAVLPEGLTVGYGIPFSVLILIVVAVVMTLVARRTRLGRYIFATGGNPDAAELSGINTRFLTVKVFAIMGGLCALAAVVASARLGFSTNDIGMLDELAVIAAAVIGGTALAGGIGTIYGAILGALIMQSMKSGMAMVGVDAPLQSMVVGIVLVLAVWIDIQYRKRRGD
ncbi:D-xylose transport system permease protein [Labrenzia sp. EL_208]|nr:D-xylose transport system permease protein [Labrenzia sp. EL_162]MBG6164647.1 D-xylose transport system permease protein [Labrenzia sp. EL_195]MBG6174895.1 D-xylose transport system permease protein [Labrenzia sp. EL_132]MBG6193833.1 D-xylose transport system permease protein [Labrenzia sp. EL_159]MBG6229507.1 D-xylose transport system permease protein [Labrenzia sp. EL_208]